MTQGEHYSSPGKGRSSPGRSSPDLYHNKLSNHSRARPMWRQHVETSERGWLTNKIALFGQFSELLPHPAPIICRALTRLQAPEATPRLLSQYHIPHLITCSSVRPKDLAHLRPMSSQPDEESACLPVDYAILGGARRGTSICQTVSVLKAYASPASERRESQTQT